MWIVLMIPKFLLIKFPKLIGYIKNFKKSKIYAIYG